MLLKILPRSDRQRIELGDAETLWGDLIMRAAIALIGFMLIVGSAIAATGDLDLSGSSSISTTATWGIAAN